MDITEQLTHESRIALAAAAEITRLRARLEVRDDGGPDGILCRDESIRMQDAEIARLRAEVDLVIAQREAWRVSALTCQRSSAEFAANADRLRAEVEALKSLSERLKLEAQIHAQEARTANATIAECYQAVAGGKGEPGNWHGAQPVRDCIEALRADAERADAERYRHLKAHHVREYPDDNGTLCIEFWCDFDNWDDIDAAIDAARAAQGERG